MKNITVKYGVDSITKQVEDDFTFGDRSTVIPAGATVRLETAANTKA